MIGVGIESATICSSCKASVPINALVPSVYCPSCAGVIRLSAQSIAELVKEALARPAALRHNEGRRCSVWTPDGRFDVNYLRMEPRCEYCGAAVAADQAVDEGAVSGRVFCGQCGAGLSVRPPPAELAPALPGVSHLFGEDIAQLVAAGATTLVSAQQGQAVPCSSCGAALALDGSSREVQCSYCGVSMVLPDQIWARLHPSKAMRRWFALVADTAATAVGAAPAASSWPEASDACADAQGTIYCVNSDVVFAIDPHRMQVRWMQHGHGLRQTQVAVTFDGRVMVWSDLADSARVYHANDGRPCGQLGGMEAPDAQVHCLDFFNMSKFACDADGSFLGLFRQRLVRFDPQGNGVPTWPEQKGLLSAFKRKARPAPLWRPCSTCPTDPFDQQNWNASRQRLAVGAGEVSGFNWMNFKLENVGSQPVAFGWTCRPTINVGYDGFLYVLGSASSSDERVLTRFDREGRKMYAVVFSAAELAPNTRPCATPDGTAFVLAKQGECRLLLRISPDGQIVTIAKARAMGGPLGYADDLLALAPDGTAFVLGGKNRLKVFGPDGRVLGMTPTSQRDLE